MCSQGAGIACVQDPVRLGCESEIPYCTLNDPAVFAALEDVTHDKDESSEVFSKSCNSE